MRAPADAAGGRAVTAPKRCRDCGPEAGPRPATFPGPRCATHNRAAVKAAKDRAHDRSVCRRFGLYPGEYAEILAAQGGRCFICQRATGKAKRLAVDHDHKCCPELPACGNCVRGLVCGWCNEHVIGHLRDNVLAARRLLVLLGGGGVGPVLRARRAARAILADQDGRLGPLADEWLPDAALIEAPARARADS